MIRNKLINIVQNDLQAVQNSLKRFKIISCRLGDKI